MVLTPHDHSHASVRILLVDDEIALRDVLAVLLRYHGFIVDTAIDGLDALAKLGPDLCRFDLVITDNQMPRMDGTTLIRSLRSANFGGKIIVFSSSLAAQRAAALSTLGVDAIVEKGQSGATLVEEIHRVAIKD
jgi:two-component system, OmpR family, response regulator